MNAGWPRVPLADMCSQVQYGYTASSSEEPIGPKFLRITDIVPNVLIWDDVPYCQIESDKLAKYQLRAGDIVVARTGATVGYAKFINAPPTSVFASYLVRFRVDDADDPRYVGKVIESSAYKEYVKAHAGGAAQPNANAQVLGSFPVPRPPLEIQRSIAAVLAAYDELIENNLRRIEILEEMAQALYREWFIEFRFPGHETIEMIESELGPIPEGWTVARLGDHVELAYGKALKAADRQGGDVPVYGSSGVIGWHDTHLVSGPGIVVGRKGNVGSVHWVESDFYPIDTTFYVVSEVPLPYLLHNLQHQTFLNSDAAVPGLSRNQAYSNPLLVPPIAVLASFVEAITPMGCLAKNLRDQNATLRTTRDLLLPKLVSGEIDVSDLDVDSDWLVA